MTTTEKKIPVDRHNCDRCGARSKMAAILPSGAQLIFCMHHFKEHEPKLQELGALIAERQD